MELEEHFEPERPDTGSAGPGWESDARSIAQGPLWDDGTARIDGDRVDAYEF